MNEFLSNLHEIGVFDLPMEWVQGVLDCEYQSFEDYPLQQKDPTDLFNLVNNLLGFYTLWLEDSGDGEEKTCHTLSSKFEIKSLLVLLGMYMKNSLDDDNTAPISKKTAIIAARLYFKLVVLPGNEVYQIYHEELFLKALSCLTFIYKACLRKARSLEVTELISFLPVYVGDLSNVVLHLPFGIDNDDFNDKLLGLLEINHCAVAYRYIESTQLPLIIFGVHHIIHMCIQKLTPELQTAAINKVFKYMFMRLAVLANRYGNSHVCMSYKCHIKYMISVYGEDAINALLCLMQLLAHNQDTFDKADVRGLRVIAVGQYFSLLPNDKKEDYVSWLVKLAKVSKVGHRQMAIEIMYAFLTMPREKLYESQLTVQPESSPRSRRQRGRRPARVTGESRSSRDSRSSTDSRVSIDSRASTDSVATIETANLEGRPDINYHTSPYNLDYRLLFGAIVERILDPSGTIRTRVLNIIAELVASDNEDIYRAIIELNTTDLPISKIALKMLLDIRATARKISLKILQKLVQRCSDQLNDEHYDAIIRSCRDECISVRMAAISIIFEMRNTEKGMDLYMEGPLRQIMDYETKVQEEVKFQIDRMLLQPLSDNTLMSDMPWRFVDAIIKKNMLDYLKKAFDVCPSSYNYQIIIRNLHTYLLSKEEPPIRKLHCLTIMNATSINVHDDFDAGFIVKYYYRLAETPEGYDIRVVITLFELMANWKDHIPQKKREGLYIHVLESLRAGIWNIEGVRLACIRFLIKMKPQDTTWATDLMKYYEELSLSGSTIDTWLACADLSQGSSEPPSKQFQLLLKNSLSIDRLSTWDGCIVAALGRVAIKSRFLANMAGPVLSTVFSTVEAPMAVRINALHAITDIASNYSGVLEPLMGVLCQTLSPDSPQIIRRTVSQSFTQLLLGGYMKLRRPFVCRYWLLMFDEDAEVSEPVQFYLRTDLEVKAILHGVLPCIHDFHGLNDLNLEMNVPEQLRQAVYNEMMTRLNPKQKWDLQLQFAERVIKEAADNVNITEEGSDGIPPKLRAVLVDTFNFMLGPKLRPQRRENNDDMNREAEVDPNSHTARVLIASKVAACEALLIHSINLFLAICHTGTPLVKLIITFVNYILKEYRPVVDELNTDAEFADLSTQYTATLEKLPASIRNSTRGQRSLDPEPAPDPDDVEMGPPRTPAIPRTPRAYDRSRASRSPLGSRSRSGSRSPTGSRSPLGSRRPSVRGEGSSRGRGRGRGRGRDSDRNDDRGGDRGVERGGVRGRATRPRGRRGRRP